MVQTMALEPTSRAGKTQVIKSIFLLKRFTDDETRATLQVRSPLDVSGVSYLWIDTSGADRLQVYLPSLQRVRRITGKSAGNNLLGSDFTYEDVKYLRGVSAGGTFKRLADAEVQSRPAYTLELTPAPSDDSAYQRVVFHIDQKTCVPLQIDFYNTGDTPIKRMSAAADSLKKLGKRWIAQHLTMRNLRKNTHTALKISQVEFDNHINDAVFNPRGFYLAAYMQDSK